ncbi:hypothetical protein J0X14_17640 [Muricauda sp. CAU 1633]|uniref:hypothetical protein n=1 Tax=Allomuricauda sp. CAU 1633 TaxID=2816036 RepID=UPI001A8E15B2|nr:hypothetical protein [Muricauda sp. CAU 1633]MBO0324137.1 hypothetical protein [Muricauda sp. CAU 1633]
MGTKKLKFILLLSLSLGLWVSCKSVNPVVNSTNTNIIGSWEGCDGRVVAFYANENGEIEGRYSKLGGLDRFKFTVDEIGFLLTQKNPGVYTGRVKWRNTAGTATWRDETIVVENKILKTSGSDACGNEMTKVESL